MTPSVAKVKPQSAGVLPPRSDRLFRAFRWYAGRYCARHLHAFRLLRTGLPPRLNGPAIFVVNHPSWWDPLLMFRLTALFPGRVDWGVIDASALKQYRFLGRAGLFGVEPGSPRGAAEFLRTARTILRDDRASLWINGQGRFADVRERPLELRGGAGRLASELPRVTVVPVALELTFWDQRTPEALAAFGEVIALARPSDWNADTWTRQMSDALEKTQGALAAAAISRDASRFDVLVQGRAGVGGVYDVWRRWTSWARGRSFRAEHH